MMTRQFRRLCLAALLIGAAHRPCTAFAAPPETESEFAFGGPEIFPIDNQISLLRAADLNGDGLTDLVVVNNKQSRIDLLYNQTGHAATAPSARPRKYELNELPPDSRFRIDSIASEKRISALVVRDLNGDGRPDLAYYGEPKELVVQYNRGTNGWALPKRWPLDDGLLNPNALVAGDINNDGRLDLLLLAENYVYVLAQGADHLLKEPRKIPYSGEIKSIQVLDLDGDRRNDLLLVNWDRPNPIRFRLQNKDGGFGPEIPFAMTPIRSYWADDLDGDGKAEIVTIAEQSGRAEVGSFQQRPAERLSGDLRRGQFEVLPLARTSKARRGIAWGDVNGDRRPDLLVAEPDSGQLTVYLQQPGGVLGVPRVFPCLAGVSDLLVADWNEDGKAEIFLLSNDERQVGVTHMDAGGRIPFPDILPLAGRPLAMAVGRLAGARTSPARPPVLAVVVDEEGKRALELLQADGTNTLQRLSPDFKSKPSSLGFYDVDQDGLNDLVMLIPYEKIKVLRQRRHPKTGLFEELDVAPPGGTADQPWMTSADVDGDGKPELLLAQKNFLRAVVLESEPAPPGSKKATVWRFHVKDQINGAASSSQIVGAVALRTSGHKEDTLFLLDADRKSLTLCERDRLGVWRARQNIPVPVSDFHSLQAVSLGADHPNCLALIGLNSVAWMRLEGKVWKLVELDGYETPIENGYLLDVVSGDLNQDGRKDLVFLETAHHYLDLVTFTAADRLVPVNRWPVFEERTFRLRRNTAPEPREALITDLTGDHRNDLAILVHDRILVYPQEPPEGSP